MSIKRTKAYANSGFTLLEMLIAIGIFAMLGLAANAVLHTVMTNDTATREFSNKLSAMQQGFGVISRDLNQMVARTPRSVDGGRGKTVFQTGSDLFDSESEALVFYRLGWLNPDGILPRGSIQSVAYVVIDGKLERWYFPYPDQEVGTEPVKTVIMDNVMSVEYSFFSDKQWQKKTDATTLPQAIAISVEFNDLTKIQRKFLLPQGITDTPNSGNENNASGSDDDDGTGG